MTDRMIEKLEALEVYMPKNPLLCGIQYVNKEDVRAILSAAREEAKPVRPCGACNGTGLRTDEAGEYVCTLCEGTGRGVPLSTTGFPGDRTREIYWHSVRLTRLRWHRGTEVRHGKLRVM